MQRTNFLAASAVGVVASLAGAGLATAQNMMPGQAKSNQNLRLAYGVIAGMVDELNQDPSDYGGHRVGAVKSLEEAKIQLFDALKSRNQVIRGQGSADSSLRYAERATARIIEDLKGQSDDYGGHRVAAIDALNAAERELRTALTVH